MEFDNIIEEKVKVKRKYRIPLIIIGVIITLLIGIGCYLYFRAIDPKSVYATIIDRATDSILEALDNVSVKDDKLVGYGSEFAFDLSSSNNEYIEIASILNKIQFNIETAYDMEAKKANVKLDASYKNDEMVNAKLFINNDIGYIDLGNLYDRQVKISDLGVEELWETSSYESYKTTIRELSNILKNNLKDEYFTNERESIQVLGKKVKANKSTLTLTDETINELLDNVLSDMRSNDKLVSALSSISGLSREEMKETLNIDEEIELEGNKYVIHIYQKGMDIVKVVLNINGEKLIVSKAKDNEYEVSINMDGDNEVIGSIVVNEDACNMLLNSDGTIMEIKYNDESVFVKTEVPESVVELKMNAVSDSLVDGYIRFISAEEDIDLRVDFTLENRNIQKIEEMDISKPIDLEAFDENEYNIIMNNLMKNNAVMSLVQDIASISLFSSLMTY